jgi:beta-glucosidase
VDFWGVNYYYRVQVNYKLDPHLPFQLSFRENGQEGNSDLGWENYSLGLLDTLKWLRQTRKPVMITENGISTDDDRQRVQFLENSLSVVQKARKLKFPVLGYLHWAFMDNYEWLEGKSARFGLIHVDYDNDCARSIKDSGKYYADYISSQHKTS